MHVTSKIISTNPTKSDSKIQEDSAKLQDINTETPLPLVETESVSGSVDKNPEKVFNTKLTLKNFKQSIVEMYAENNRDNCKFEDIPSNFVIEQFAKAIESMSDDEKEKNFSFVMNEFKSKPELIAVYIRSIQNKNIATNCAESINLDTIAELNQINENAALEIVKHLSKNKLIDYLKQNDENFKSLYNEKGEIINSVLDKVQKGESLSKEELEIKKSLDAFIELKSLLEIGAYESECLTETEQADVMKAVEQSNKQYPPLIQDYYVKYLATYVSSHRDSLDFDKLTRILDITTDNKFSEQLQIISEKSATDESGKFKTASEEVIAKSEEKIQAIKQSIEEASTSEPIVAEIKNSKSETANASDTGIVSYETITGDDSAGIIKDIFTGKIKVSEYLEQVAIKKYKLMDTAMQGNILLNATGEFFNDLVKTLETSTFEHLLSVGWKGRSYDATQRVKDEIEERKNDVA